MRVIPLSFPHPKRFHTTPTCGFAHRIATRLPASVTWTARVAIPSLALLLLAGSPVQAEQQWTLATQDTSLTIRSDGQTLPAITQLKTPTQPFNWTSQPSPLPLLSGVVRDGQTVPTHWQFQGAAVDNSNGTRLTLRYADDATGLTMTSEWWARPGAGPIRQASILTNAGRSPVGIPYQPTFALQLTAPQTGALQAWHFANDGGGGGLDPQGVYHDLVTGDFHRTLHTDPNAANSPIPLAVLDSAGNHGLYVGTEWSFGDIQIAATAPPPGQLNVTIQSGNIQNFQATLQPGQAFTVPPGFVGTYRGDIDAAGNSLRKYLFQHSMPAALRGDPGYPKVQWNAFTAAGKGPGSWDPAEKGFYPLIDDMTPLGFEEVMIDVGWWQTALGQDGDPNADPQDWPAGMKAAADYAHRHGIRFGLYWTDKQDMTTPAGRQTRADRIKKLFQQYSADMWRSDNTGGPVVTSDYWSVKGFYEMVDALQQQIPNFQWENCSSGGRIKDFGAMKRAVKIFNSDNFSELSQRKIFYDSSFAFHPMQLEGHLATAENNADTLRPKGAAALKSAFRSMSMGAPEWVLDAPNGGNGNAPWTDEEKQAVAACVNTYKTKIRPLIRNADLYHIFPRPDGRVWDGIEYYDPATGKGVVYIFKPDSPNDTQTITL